MPPEEHKRVYSIFLKWYAMPESSRQPASIPEFCTEFNIDKSVIAGFMHLEDFTDDLYKASIQWGKSKVPELLHLLYEKYLISKNPNDLRMYKDLLNLDKADRKEESQDDVDRKGLLRELFENSR